MLLTTLTTKNSTFTNMQFYSKQRCDGGDKITYLAHVKANNSKRAKLCYVTVQNSKVIAVKY